MPIKKDCDNCNKPIILDNKSGKWLPYNPDGSAHRCKGKEDTKIENVQDETPNKVPRQTAARVEILANYTTEKLQNDYNNFLELIWSYGAIVRGSTYRTLVEDDRIVYTIAVFYEIAKNAIQEVEK